MAALIGIAANLRAVLAAHVALQFVDGRRLRPAHDVQRHCLVCVTAEAADLEIEISCVLRVAEAGRGLSRSFESEHALVPGDTRQTVSVLPSLGRALRRMPNRTAEMLSRDLVPIKARMRQPGVDRQAATAGLGTAYGHCRSWMLKSAWKSRRARAGWRSAAS
jgi:hypothetical protein